MYYIRDQFNDLDYGESEPEEKLDEFIARCKKSGPLFISARATDLVVWEDERKVVGVLRASKTGININFKEV